jgi:outer membrane protein TolC
MLFTTPRSFLSTRSVQSRPPLGSPGKLMLIATLCALAVSGCASYSGIGDGNKIAQPKDFAARQSIAGSGGNWPAVDWIAQFGDPQLSALVDEGMAGNPTLQQAQARIDAANATAIHQRAGFLYTQPFL